MHFVRLPVVIIRTPVADLQWRSFAAPSKRMRLFVIHCDAQHTTIPCERLTEAQGQSPWNRFDRSRFARNPFGCLVFNSRGTSKNYFPRGTPQNVSWIS